jgi:hypothetical protein
MADNNEYMFITGRLVQGDVFVPQTKNMTGGPLTDLKGNPKVQYFIGVAVPKTDQAMLAEWAKLQAIAQAGFPGGESQRPDFAWKVVDGDAPANAGQEGFAGCMVFRLTSGFPVKAYTQGAASQIVDPQQIKRGHYVRAVFTAKANGNAQKPGLYLNTALVELVGYGEEISAGPDAAALLGQAGAAALPQGASAAPVAGGPPIIPGAQPQSTSGMPPFNIPGAPAPQPGGMPPAPGITPAPDFLAPPPAAPAGPVMTAKAAGHTYQQFVEKGWKDDQLIAQGYMEVPA